jgi:hypothetical protein
MTAQQTSLSMSFETKHRPIRGFTPGYGRDSDHGYYLLGNRTRLYVLKFSQDNRSTHHVGVPNGQHRTQHPDYRDHIRPKH